jgi:protein-tyrosine kinase
MSRIHEALKKAAQERSTKRPDSIGHDLGDFPPAVLPTAGPTPTVLAPNSPGNLTGLGVSEFPAAEEFLERCSHPLWNIDPKLNVFSESTPSVQGAERFRTLRSRLLQFSVDQPLHRILITSSVPQEGKTFVAANLAQSFVCQADRRVLLIDADIRAPRLHVHFGAPAGPGLSDYLLGDADETQVLQVGPEGNLCLIPGGRQVANASELLHSDQMKHLLKRMSDMFDYVILDSPPALAVYDASILADYCDGVLFVVRAGYTDFEVAERASMEFRNKNLLGVVLNRAEESDTYGGYYDHYYAKPQSTNGKRKPA